ncbi:MAG: cytochrome c biogenesis protein CcdA [Candidatus Dependentiae bacterium]|jgi:thiol:disulfide interchange protein DsbD
MFLESLLSGQHSLILVLFASFAAGMLASFTPCIYPMIPITVGIITAQRSGSMLMNFFLALSYGIGIASVYAVLGYLSATSSLMFGQWLGNPWFIAAMVAFFVYLAFAMFGFYEMYTPKFLRAQSNSGYKGGSVTYSFLFGVLTGAAASPCLTPALALLLSFAAKQTPIVGLSVLFSFAMGLSMILIVVGTFSSALEMLPRAGGWMNEVKIIFGFALLGVCIGFAQPLFELYWAPFLYGLLALAASLYYFNRSKKDGSFSIPFMLLGIFLLITAGLFCVESYLQHDDSTLLEYVESVFVNKKPS